MKTPLIFDNDCISSFLWIKRLDIILTLFKGSIIVPEAVENELANMKRSTKYKYVYFDLKDKIDDESIKIEEIPATSVLAQEYGDLISGTNSKRIGKGEAATIVLAKNLSGTVASNNLRDILPYVKDGVPPYVCTDEILYLFYKEGHMSIEEGKKIWNEMKNYGRKLPNYDFDVVVHRFENGIGR